MLPNLNLIDGADLNESQEDQIDEIIRDMNNFSIAITPKSESPVET